MSDRFVALLRGVNVGRAGRLAMADLRALVEDLGYSDVRTLLNSGNVAFTAPGADPVKAAALIEKALTSKLGAPVRVVVVTARELCAVADENPLLDLADDPSRLLVAFLVRPEDATLLAPLLLQDWSPEALGVGEHAVYLWCPAGVAASRVAQAVARAVGDGVTMRNWSTVVKLRALAG